MATTSRQSTGKITQIKPFGFEKINDSYEGTYTGTKHAQLTDENGQPREATLILLQPDSGSKFNNGERFGVWANAVLEDLIAQVPTGTYVKITHTEVGKKKGKRSPAKLFEIETFA